MLDRTLTAMGSRMLADWLANPLTADRADRCPAGGRGRIGLGGTAGHDLREQLKSVHDVERLLARVTTGRASPRDLEFLGRTLRLLPQLKAKLTARSSTLLEPAGSANSISVPISVPRLEAALVDDCPLLSREGGFIRPGFHAGSTTCASWPPAASSGSPTTRPRKPHAPASPP